MPPDIAGKSELIFPEKPVYTGWNMFAENDESEILMQRLLILCGILLLLAGLLWPWLSKLPFGRLPGDIVIERENFRLYFPLTSGLLVSLVLSFLLWWWTRK
ncbi:Protein of unknown function [Nitrosospira multiformis ATCC 25196]|uniref:DUF2905 family protein n=1 Tax=Nitrosospira multiformis (strain ATCC 25196 / NCIMB 11849 / C 71) TaxID=323848 RepID=Q2YAE3_NITMU|nr:DUF2905 domain-containing protein [Nitrosospira multiformis]ABB74278.1 hypothetical protein Nmul_A0975 [Nitrosospira multiformis ATCC 25196]SEF49336.1 Protein of unknown function [Nitrosospira multiformis ATCC 25196]